MSIRTNTHDLEVAYSCLGEEFEPLATALPPDFGGVLIDAGGYIGTAAIKLSGMFPNAHVVSLEPSTENYELAKVNTARHPNITLVKAALVPVKTGNVLLRDRGTGEWGFSIVDQLAEQGRSIPIEHCETITIEELRSRFGSDIGLIKLDIEGAEKALFDDASEAMASVNVVFVELHDRIISGCTAAFQRFSETREVSLFGGEKFLSVRR